MTIALVTDSTSDLPPELLQKYAIEVVPLHILWGVNSYKDGVEMTVSDFYARLERDKSELPKTSQPAPGEFADAYHRARERSNADEVLCITLSKTLSGTHTSAEAARAIVDFPVRVVDSVSVSMGLGFAVLAAAEAREHGAGVEEMAQAALHTGECSQILFSVNTLEFLHRGGRIGGAQRLIGTALNIKPILSVSGGQVGAVESARTRKRALARLIEIAERRKSPAVQVAVLRTSPDAEAEQFAAEVKAALNPTRLIEATFCAAVGVHTGPGVIGIVMSDQA